jgi:hypothetical protein
MKITVFSDVAPCSLVEVHQRFRGDGPDDGGRKSGRSLPTFQRLLLRPSSRRSPLKRR